MEQIKRFEFVPGDEIVIAPGRTVKRVRALVAIAALGVSPGDLGGYVEKEGQVYGDAWVSGNARVYGNARVSGDARVYGDAWVYGCGLIFWASIVGTENGTLTVYNGNDNTLLVTRGCFCGTVDEFLARSADKHDERTRTEYRLLIDVARSRIEHARTVTAVPADEVAA